MTDRSVVIAYAGLALVGLASLALLIMGTPVPDIG